MLRPGLPAGLPGGQLKRDTPSGYLAAGEDKEEADIGNVLVVMGGVHPSCELVLRE
jgi:hypothetical protein